MKQTCSERWEWQNLIRDVPRKAEQRWREDGQSRRKQAAIAPADGLIHWDLKQPTFLRLPLLDTKTVASTTFYSS